MDAKHPLSTSFTRTDVEITRKTTSFERYFRIDKYHLRHVQHAGGMGPELSREVFECGHAVCALLYDPDLELLVFIEQFRVGALAAMESPWYGEDVSPWLIEIVAGIIEDGEEPVEVIRREAIEEAGCKVHETELISHYLVSPGGTSESMFSFCGRVDATGVGGIHGVEEEGEDIRVFALSPEDAFNIMDEGLIYNSMTLIAMQWFRFHHHRLREKWRKT